MAKKVRKEKLEQALSGELFAAQEATEMVLSGVPFRDAYRKVAVKFD